MYVIKQEVSAHSFDEPPFWCHRLGTWSRWKRREGGDREGGGVKWMQAA